VKPALVVAADENDLIGSGDALPWHLPEDLRRFKARTLGHAVVVGRTTQRSIERMRGKPLPGRRTIALSRTESGSDDAVRWVRDAREAVLAAEEHCRGAGQDEYFVIGGAAVYAEFLPLACRIYLTRVHDVFEGDVSMPPGWLDGFAVESEEAHVSAGGTKFSYVNYVRA
jgi:dihydrofolate reductase